MNKSKGRNARLKDRTDKNARYFQRNGKSGRTKKASRRWFKFGGPYRMPML